MSALANRDRVENLSERRELSAAAKALLNDAAFSHVYNKLYNLWFRELMNERHANVAQDELCARLRALDVIPTELALLLENYRVDAQRAARNG